MKQKKIKIRLFIGHTCPICDIAMQKIELEKDVFEYVYWYAIHSETQDFCDENNVDELPHMQILDEDDKVIEECIGADVLTALRDICD